MRASTDEQLLSADAQRAAIEAWAAKEGVRIVSWQVDLGVSGGSDLEARPGLLAALADLGTYHAGFLVVARRDRLARDVTVAGIIARATQQAGARVVSADGIANGEGPSEEFLKSILNAVAQYEKSLISQRTKEALRTLRARGYRAGSVPYGFTADGETGKLLSDPKEQAAIARVKELRGQGFSLRQVVEKIACEGFCSRVGTPLHLTQVARLARG